MHLVAYAGNADLGMHTIRKLKDASIDELARGLFASSQEAGEGPGSVEYLLADTRRGVQRITADNMGNPGDTGWIGDPAAFDVYQCASHDQPVPELIWIEGIDPPA